MRRLADRKRWPDGFVCPACGHEKGWALRRAHTFECAGSPADLGDGRDDPARQQAAAHRRYPMATQFPTAVSALQSSSVSALPQRLSLFAHKLRASMVARGQPVVGPGGNRRGRPSIPDRRSSHRRARIEQLRRRLIAHRRLAIRTRARNIPAACGWPKSPPTACRPRTLVETAADPDAIAKTDAGPACGPRRSPQCPCRREDRRSPRPADPPSFSSKDGREASTTGCVASICRPISNEFVFRFNRRKTRHAAFRSLFRLATNAEPLTYSMLIEPEPCA